MKQVFHDNLVTGCFLELLFGALVPFIEKFRSKCKQKWVASHPLFDCVGQISPILLHSPALCVETHEYSLAHAGAHAFNHTCIWLEICHCFLVLLLLSKCVQAAENLLFTSCPLLFLFFLSPNSSSFHSLSFYLPLLHHSLFYFLFFTSPPSCLLS